MHRKVESDEVRRPSGMGRLRPGTDNGRPEVAYSYAAWRKPKPSGRLRFGGGATLSAKSSPARGKSRLPAQHPVGM